MWKCWRENSTARKAKMKGKRLRGAMLCVNFEESIYPYMDIPQSYRDFTSRRNIQRVKCWNIKQAGNQRMYLRMQGYITEAASKVEDFSSVMDFRGFW